MVKDPVCGMKLNKSYKKKKLGTDNLNQKLLIILYKT